MFADDEMEMTPEGEEADTVHFSGEDVAAKKEAKETAPKAEPKKKKDPREEWVTAPMSKVSKEEAAPPVKAAPAPAPKKESAADMAAPTVIEKPETASPFGASVPATSAAPASGSSGEGIAFMSNLGISDPRTQKIVLGVGGGLIFLCCACSCILVVISLMNSGSF